MLAAGRFCDGGTRRDFLKVGGMALGGLSLTGLLRAEAASGVVGSHKSVIMVFLPGGPPHQDTFDLKPDAPEGIRGEFKPIPTNVPGLEICEHLPRLARMMDKFAVIRTIVGARGEHAAVQCLTGYSEAESKQAGGRPSLGAVVSRLQGPVVPAVPAFVGLSGKMGFPAWADNGAPGYLGAVHAPFTPNSAEATTLTMSAADASRLAERRLLLNSFDQLRRDVDADGSIEGAEANTRRAFEILTSSRLAEALDLSREDPRLRDRYGVGDLKPVADGGAPSNELFLRARRLVEAGARVVTLGYGRWDNHADNFNRCRRYLPMLDQGVSALVEDIHARGLDKDVSVVVWGEFGRSPKISPSGGRDHWPSVSCALLAGGGMRTGVVLGRTDRLAEAPKERPITFQNVFATIYHNLGINPAATVPNHAGRPMALLDEVAPIVELI